MQGILNIGPKSGFINTINLTLRTIMPTLDPLTEEGQNVKSL